MDREREANAGAPGGVRERRTSGGAPGGAPPAGVELELTGELVEEVLRTALALEGVFTALLEELPPDAFPGRADPAVVLMEMVVGSTHPAAKAAGVHDCRAAITLVIAIRERVLADLHTASELAKDRDRLPPPTTKQS
jgi:hypothetical protein